MGDIVLSTDNAVFLRGAQKHLNIITYEKEQVPVQTVNHSNTVKTDLRGLGTGVGGFSNCATIIETMKAIFTKESQQLQRDELNLRKKLLREIVGAEIDRIKGTTAPVLPSEWKKFVQINPDDTDEDKAEKYRHNSLVISKKPYFFRYLYPELNRRYKQYENAYNLLSKDMFGIKFKKLLVKPNKTEDEKTLVRRYQKYSPLIVSDCTMNILCREFEDIDFVIKFKQEAPSLLPTYEDQGYECDPEILAKFREAYRKYNNKKAIRVIDTMGVDLDDTDVKELKFSIVDIVKNDIQEEIFGLGLDPKQILFYIGQLAKEYKKFNYNFAWDILEDFIIECIPQGRTFAPVRDDNGQDYLGEKYVLKEVTKGMELVEEEDESDD